MNFKKILRSPILLVVLAIVGISIGFSLITGTGFRSSSCRTARSRP
jgi:cell division protease FtsH